MKYVILSVILLTAAATKGQQKKSIVIEKPLITTPYELKTRPWFSDEQLITTGVYYYPEHWDSLQWERDIKNIADMGFEFVHYAEFAWAQLEPEEGKYTFGWLDRVVELAARYNLKVIMCTSTATPPVWLVRKHPDVLITGEYGHRDDHGSRQHASFSSNYYRSYSLTMIEELARRYGDNEQIIGWQLDNEPRACYDYGDDAQQRFRDWLKQKYGTINNLNKAWGTSFWSQLYNDFSQINIPLRSRWGMNLHQRMDHNRFVAHETASFLDSQAQTIRKYAGHRQWITMKVILVPAAILILSPIQNIWLPVVLRALAIKDTGLAML